VGAGELILILVIVLIIFGAGKLPQIGDALGKGIRNFRKSSSGKEDIDVDARPAAAESKALPPPAKEAAPVEVKEVKSAPTE
jgi:sec-independent protein translocase protein TatA